jgi:hypothetical protein
VWAWLLQPENSKIRSVISTDRSSAAANNPIDLSEFDAEPAAGILNVTRVNMPRSQDCAAQSYSSFFDIVCDTTSAASFERGVLATDVLKDLERLKRSIINLQATVYDAIKKGIESVRLRIVEHYVRPVLQVLKTFVNSTATQEDREKSRVDAIKTIQSNLKIVRVNLDVKLYRPFVRYETEVVKNLVDKLNAAKVPRPLPVPTGPFASLWKRTLPQRIGKVKYLYGIDSVADWATATGLADTETSALIVQSRTKLSNAIQAQSTWLQRERTALSNLIQVWESLKPQHRIQQVQLFASDNPALRQLPRVPLRVDTISSIFVNGLSGTPPDLARLATTSRFTELDELRAELIVRDSESVTTSILEELGVSDTGKPATSIIYILGALWVEELVAFHEYTTAAAAQSHVMGTRLRRVVRRMRECAAFFDSVLVKVTSPLIPSTATLPSHTTSPVDPLYKATRAGRDARFVMDVCMGNEDHAMFASKVAVVLRSVAADAERALKKNETLLKFVRLLPVEAFRTLFHDPVAAVHALRRARLLLSNLPSVADRTKHAIESAVVSVYGPAQLLASEDDGPTDAERLDAYDRAFGAAIRPCTVDTVVPCTEGDSSTRSMLQRRIARFRLDVPFDDRDDDSWKEDGWYKVDQLALQFAGLGRASDASLKFLVPFGYGSFPRPLVSSAPSMAFGSVPVLVQTIVETIDVLIEAINRKPDDDATADFVLTPLGECFYNSATDRKTGAAVVPELIQLAGTQLGFVASAPASEYLLQTLGSSADFQSRASNCREASERFKRNSAESKFVRSTLSSMLWNTERVLQCLAIAAAHSNDERVAPTIHMDLLLKELTLLVTPDEKLSAIGDALVDVEYTANLYREMLVELLKNFEGWMQKAADEQEKESDPLGPAGVGFGAPVDYVNFQSASLDEETRKKEKEFSDRLQSTVPLTSVEAVQFAETVEETTSRFKKHLALVIQTKFAGTSTRPGGEPEGFVQRFWAQYPDAEKNKQVVKKSLGALNEAQQLRIDAQAKQSAEEAERKRQLVTTGKRIVSAVVTSTVMAVAIARRTLGAAVPSIEFVRLPRTEDPDSEAAPDKESLQLQRTKELTERLEVAKAAFSAIGSVEAMRLNEAALVLDSSLRW